MITEHEQAIIVSCLPKIRSNVKKSLWHSPQFRFEIDKYTEEALSYIVDIYCERWKGGDLEQNKKKFIQYASFVAVCKLKDHYIKHVKKTYKDGRTHYKNRCYSLQSARREWAKSLEQEEEYEISSEDDRYIGVRLMFHHQKPSDDWLDLKRVIKDKAYRRFGTKQNTYVYYYLIINYFLPKADGVDITLREIGETLGIKDCTIRYKLRDKTIETFFKELGIHN